jgi:hypothetical protein
MTHLRVQLSWLTSANGVLIINDGKWYTSYTLPTGIKDILLNFRSQLVRCKESNSLTCGTKGLVGYEKPRPIDSYAKD